METFKNKQFILDKAYAIANANGYTDEFVKKYVEGFELGYSKYSKACKKGFSDVFAKIYAEGFAEGYAEGFPEGYAEGFPEGYAEGFPGGVVFENFVKRILESGKTPEDIADFCHIDLEKVKEVQEKILE